MSAYVHVTDSCQGCGACLLTCPEHAIRPAANTGGVPLTVRADRCTGCGECLEVCPVDAIEEAIPVSTLDDRGAAAPAAPPPRRAARTTSDRGRRDR